MADDTIRVSHIVPRRVRDDAQANTERGEISDAVRTVYRAFAHGEAYPGVERHAAERTVLKRTEERIEDYQSALGDVRDKMAERRAELDDEREQRTASRDEYEGRLRDLEERIRDGSHVDPEHGAVIDAARCSGRSPTQVVAELQQRNPEIPDHAFRPWDETDEEWDGVTP